jgi:hypothetical protein
MHVLIETFLLNLVQIHDTGMLLVKQYWTASLDIVTFINNSCFTFVFFSFWIFILVSVTS